jgi:hypothetical protein
LSFSQPIGINDESATTLASGLQINKIVVELNLSHNSIGDSGAVALGTNCFGSFSFCYGYCVKKMEFDDWFCLSFPFDFLSFLIS